MNKIRITFTISQKLSGHLKNVCVIARNVDQCWDKIHKAMNYKTFTISVLKVEEVSDSFPSGIMQAESQVVVSYRGAASLIPGAAYSDNSEPCQSHK